MRRAVGLFLVMVAPLAFLSADDGSGRTAGLTLLRTMDARPTGLGQAFSGVNGGIDSLSINPAGAATLKDPALSATYVNGITDDNMGSLAYAHPFSKGSLFLGVTYFDAGTIDITPSGGGPTTTKRAQQDQVGMLGFALGKEFPLSVGVDAKFYKFQLAETANASGVAGDAGAVWRTPVEGLSLGGAIQNFGSDLQYEVEKEPLPQVARAGVAYQIDFQKFSHTNHIPYRAMMVTDVVKIKNQTTAFAGGLELTTDLSMMDRSGSATLRGGFNSGTNNFTAGVGFSLSDLVIDYSISLLQDSLGPLHRVTLGWRFLPARRTKDRFGLSPAP